ncbi:uncharacterized protein ATNIH1004_006377 [Aspergillus tanneri]|uniref:Zona occludens toxin N-terminal domain-containing protein n=1 Tax=Aspergillus tanneri TaxID=1220188 RepID=A0A5M9MRW2_9EURO|nr:uncharacterized protein ATNIH1004_006377 [Aspergillus tanneri]KAA8647683.1 hypothetical protein ATNIH1004_006377 [Aspergillus tanneri]
MAGKANSGTDPILRKAIREEIRSCHQQYKPINREEIKARYLKKNPDLVNYINNIVDGYSDHLESKLKTANSAKSPLPTQPSNGPSPIPTLQNRPSNNIRLRDISKSLESHYQTESSRTGSSASSSQLNPVAGYRGSSGSGEESSSFDVVDSASISDNENLDNVLLQEFKDDLYGNFDKRTSHGTPAVPPLEVQKHLLASSENKNNRMKDTIPTEHAVLVSPALESCGYSMPPQFALVGKIPQAVNAIPDPRIILNTNIPFSAFVCGVQGSGKSHTTSCMIGNLRKSVSTLVLHFNEYSSTVSSQPSEAAFLASVMPEYTKQQPIPLRVLVSPTNFHNLAKMYSQIPNVQVQVFKIQPRHLNISMMLSLMSVSQNDGMPLYMAQVTRVLREMAMESGGHFDYSDFRNRLSALRLDRAQTPFLYQRLDLLDSYLDLTGKVTGDYFVDGGVTILDLSCPFVDQSTACTLFRIAIDLFLYAHPSRGKMIVADEAHKYMTDTPAAKELTETFLTIIRQQRHLGVRTIISTQEPTISPKLIDLCSIIIIHRFTSPEWYKTLQRHVPMDSGNTRSNEEGIPNGLYRIANLRTGEAIVFAPSAHLVGEDDVVIDTRHRTFRMMMRKRVTWDGGRTIVCIR